MPKSTHYKHEANEGFKDDALPNCVESMSLCSRVFDYLQYGKFSLSFKSQFVLLHLGVPRIIPSLRLVSNGLFHIFSWESHQPVSPDKDTARRETTLYDCHHEENLSYYGLA